MFNFISIGRIKYIPLLWGFLQNHKIHFLSCISLVLMNSLILGGTMSLILPIISQVFSWDIVSFGSGGGYFKKVIKIYLNVMQSAPHKELLSMGILFLGIAMNAGIQFVILYVNSSLTAKITYDCRERIYNVIQGMKFHELSQHPRGMFVQLLITETRSVYAVFKQVLTIVPTAINSFVIILLLVLLSWKLCVILLAGIFLTMCINISITRSIKKLGKKALNFRSELAKRVTEGIWGIKQLRIMQSESIMKEKINRASYCSENIARLLRIKSGFLQLVSQNLLIFGVLIIIIVWFSFPVLSEGIPQRSGIITFLMLVSRLVPYIGVISKEYGTIFSNLPAVARIQEFLEREFDLEKGGSLEPEPLFKKSIKFKDVYFEYSEDKPVLKRLTMEINRGAYIGIVGRSGGGKSTMFNLLPRIYDTRKGKILIDDLDIRKLRLKHLRSKIGMVSQDFFLFNTSIRENLLLAKSSATEDELWIALEKAGLKSFVEFLDKGLDSSVGNDGDKLSGGQRQRLALAIMFLRDPELIIMDEGTSSVDKETEKHILRSLRELQRKGKTIICGAHKESALVDAECIYNLKNGQLTSVLQ